MKSGGQRAFARNDVICLSDDDDDGGAEVAAAGSSGGDLPGQGETLTDPGLANAPLAPPPSTHAHKIGSPGSIRPSSPTQAAASPSVASFASTTTGKVASPVAATNSPAAFTRSAVASSSATKPSAATTMGVADASAREPNGNGASKEPEDPLLRQRNQVRQRNSYVQTLLSTAGCVLVIDNLEVDVQPFDVLVQLLKFGNNKGRVHSVHIPPPHPELNRAIAYVVFLKKDYADVAAAFLTRNFVVSARGRPWIVSRCAQDLDEENFGFPTLSAYKGEAQAEDANGGLRIVTESQEVEYRAAKRRRALFEEHKKQTQVLLQRHAQEEKSVEDDPELNLYR